MAMELITAIEIPKVLLGIPFFRGMPNPLTKSLYNHLHKYFDLWYVTFSGVYYPEFVPLWRNLEQK